MKSTLKKRLLNLERLIGTVVTIAAPEVTDMLSRLGFDFLRQSAGKALAALREAARE